MPENDCNDPVAPLVSSEDKAKLLALAKSALTRAYAPYSKFQVGAAVLTESGAIYSGCNVENSSYGLTNCAERTAIFSAVACEGPRMQIRAVAVWTNPEVPCAPCGACRQVIFEFGANAIILFQGPTGLSERRASEMLPQGFTL